MQTSIRSTAIMTSALAISLGIHSQQATAAVIVPTSYSYSVAPNQPNGGTLYHDGSATKLTDDTAPSGNFSGSYAAWKGGQSSVITFSFDQTYDFSTVQLFTYNNGTWAKYAQNVTVTIGGTSTNFGTLAADEPVLDVSSLNSGSSVEISFTNTAETWISEVDFDGVVPEPGSLALLGLGGLLIGTRRRRD